MVLKATDFAIGRLRSLGDSWAIPFKEDQQCPSSLRFGRPCSFRRVSSSRCDTVRTKPNGGGPRQREIGRKLTSRSVSQLARRKIGKAQYRQGDIMLGYRKASTSDLKVLFDPANLGLALVAIDAMMGEPKRFAPVLAPELKLIHGGRERRKPTQSRGIEVVGERGFEPPAPASRRQCSTRLSYSPTGSAPRTTCPRVEARRAL